MSWAKKSFYLSSSLLLAGAMSMAQSTPGTMPGSSASSQDQDSSMAGQAAGASLRGCLSGSSDNYTLTDHNGTIYHLVGESVQLQSLVGQEVQISGTPDSRRTGVSDTTTANTASSFHVIDVRQVASTCDRGGSSASEISGRPGMRDHDNQQMSEKPPTTDSQPKGAPGEGAPPQPEPHLMAMLQQPASAASTDPGDGAAQNSNSSPTTSTPPPVSSETPAAAQSPTNPNSQLGTSPANQTGMSATGANNDATAARQGELNTNPQTGQTTGRGVDNQGINNPSQSNPNAAPTSPNSTSPQGQFQPQNDPTKPLYERTATDVPWANHSGASTTTNPNGSSTTTTTTPPKPQ